MTAEEGVKPVQLKIAADRMSATLIIEAGTPEAERATAMLEALLDERGVARTAERSALLREASDAAAAGRVEMVVVHGRPPVHGHDAHLELDPSLTPRAAPAPEGGGRVDHHLVSSIHVIHAGDRLGRVLPATAGSDGVDVTGRALASRQGRPAGLLFDESVVVGPADADGVCPITAARAGVLVRHDKLVRVSSQFDVPADVDFSVGNIDFPGDVRVAGGVRDCFIVKAEGSIEVRGLVEAATVAAGRDVRLIQGMAGREKGSLTSGRDCEAKYLEGLRVSVGRDATVGKEVTNSHVAIGRSFKAPNCSVIGGNLAVSGECELAQLGSEAGVSTEVCLGKIPAVEALLRRGLKALPVLEERVRAARERLEQLRRASGRMTASQAEELTELEFGMSEAQGKLKLLGEGLGLALAAARTHTQARLVVNRLLCPGVKVWMGRFLLEPRTEVRGPFELTLSPGGEVLVRNLPSGHAELASTRFRVVHDTAYVDLAEVERSVHRATAA